MTALSAERRMILRRLLPNDLKYFESEAYLNGKASLQLRME